MAIGTAANMKVPSSYIGRQGGGDITVRPSSEIVYTGGGGGGGGDSYRAKAVSFDGTQHLVNSALVATDSEIMLVSIWCKFATPPAGQDTFWVVDPEGTYTNAFLRSLGHDGSFQLYAVRSDPFGELLIFNAASLGWVNILAKVNTNTGVHQLYINDTLSTDDPDTDTGRPFTMEFNGLPFWFGDDGVGDALTGDIADAWLSLGTDLDLSVEANRRLFIDASGKPVDPAVAISSLGSPVVLFSGNAASFTNNQGTGGSFTVTGSLANASTSPSD